MSPLLLARIAQQGGVLSRRDVVELGHHDQDLQSWLRAGLVIQASRGAYYLSPDREPGWAELTSFERAEEHERRRAAALLTVLPRPLVASHSTALLLHGIPRLLPDGAPTVCHVMTTRRTVTSRRKGVRVHAHVAGTQLYAGEPRRVSVADAIAQTGCLGGLHAAVAAADAALRAERVERATLEAALRRVSGQPGATGLVAAVELADSRSESPGESWLRLVCRAADIAVTPQVSLGDERGPFARVDLLVDGTNVVLEFDGLGKYARDPEALRKEKVREQRLHRAGFVVVRVTWEDFRDIPALVARIRAAIARDEASRRSS